VTAPTNAPLIVLGAPGSGKTRLLIDRLQHLVAQGISPDRIRLLTPTRRQATALRDELSVALGRATRGPVVMSFAAFAFALVRADAEEQGAEPPRLRSGADVDDDLRALLAEHAASGTGPAWPEFLGPAVRQTETFRTELRELLARVTEWGVDSSWLRQHSDVHPSWGAVADFLDDYERVIARSRPHEYDSPELLRVASALVERGLPESVALDVLLIDDAQDMSPAATALMAALHQIRCPPHGGGRPRCRWVKASAGLIRKGHPGSASQLGISPVVLDRLHRPGGSLRAL
jgi:Superfamily I DNA and RNA helicases